MRHELDFTRLADDQLAALRPFDRGRLVDEIESELTHDPSAETKRKKVLKDVRPAFQFVPPLRELRVGEFRVFYDVNVEDQCVTVRSIRRKPADKTTEDILNETGNP
jgi:mRNA-degrading endonuclease RelE of RelBE toxin-antitoxin system